MITDCTTCKPHAFQDKTYGKNKRVHNLCAGGARCTVCLDVKKMSAETVKAEAAKTKKK